MKYTTVQKKKSKYEMKGIINETGIEKVKT